MPVGCRNIFTRVFVEMVREAISTINNNFVHIKNDPGRILHLLFPHVISYYRTDHARN